MEPRVWIHGSCVTRDAFALGQGTWTLAHYSARSSLASAFDLAPFEGVDVSAISSPFQRRMVQSDLEKGFTRELGEFGEMDAVVVDLIDERFDLLENEHGALATRSNELASVLPATSEAWRRIASGSDEFLELWTVGLQRFARRMAEIGALRRIVLHESYWASTTTGGGAVGAPFSESYIAKSNRILSDLCSRFKEVIPCATVIRVPDEMAVASQTHKWGVAPFHFSDAYYSHFLKELACAFPVLTHGGE